MDGGLNMKVTSEAEIQSVLALMGLGRASNTADASRSTASIDVNLGPLERLEICRPGPADLQIQLAYKNTCAGT